MNSVGSMFAVYFGPTEVRNGSDAEKADRQMFGRMFRYALDNGVYLAPSALEDCFVSIAHDDDAISRLETVFTGFMESVRQ